MDPNLNKIRDANIDLIRVGKLGQAIVHAKSYLTYILGEYQLDRINQELDDFVKNLKEIAKDKFITPKTPKRVGSNKLFS